MLPGGQPILLEGSGSGTGSAGGAKSSVGGISAEGCSACGSVAGVGSSAGDAGTGSKSGFFSLKGKIGKLHPLRITFYVMVKWINDLLFQLSS